MTTKTSPPLKTKQNSFPILRASEQIIGGDSEKFLFYGDPGTGKTFAAHTAPGPIFTLVVGPENELKAVKSKDFAKKYPHKTEQIYYATAREDYVGQGKFKTAAGFDMAGDILDQAFSLKLSGDLDFKTLVIDNATVLIEYQMNKVMELGPSGDRGTKSKALRVLQDEGILIPADYDYKGQMSLMQQIITFVTEQNVHLVLVAHERMETVSDRKTQAKEIVSISPQFTGRNRTLIPNRFDNVWRFTASGSGKARQFKAQTVGSSEPPTMAKTRLGSIVPFLYANVNLEETIKKFQTAQSSPVGSNKNQKE